MRPPRRFLPILFLAAVLLAPRTSGETGPTKDTEAPRLAARDLFADPIWDDGRAEYTIYRGTIERYGAKRALEARLIVVKEDMDAAQRVKSEKGPIPGKTWPVLKQNYSQDFTTGTYDYHQMSSAFLDRESGLLHKLTVSSQEACGLTFARLAFVDGGVKRVLHSYWDGEADREEVAAIPGGARENVVADALPLWLRRLDLTRQQSFSLGVLPAQLSNRAQPLAFLTMGVEVVGRPDRYGLLVRVGQILNSDVIIGDARVDRYWFDPVWPHPLVRFEGGRDSTVLVRVKTMRIAYWKENASGDERLLAP
jgi:hypothetical protein